MGVKMKNSDQLFTVFFVLLILLCLSCGNPTPEVSSISPSGKVAHLPSFNLTVNGRDFEQDSVIISQSINNGTFFKNPAFPQDARPIPENKSDICF